jgi:hypothetical protein
MEIVRTISAAENAISVLARIPTFDFFIDFPFLSNCLKTQFWDGRGDLRITSWCRGYITA